MSTQQNQQLNRCVFSEVIECLEQNFRRQIDCKRRVWIAKIEYGTNKATRVRRMSLTFLLLHPQKISYIYFTRILVYVYISHPLLHKLKWWCTVIIKLTSNTTSFMSLTLTRTHKFQMWKKSVLHIWLQVSITEYICSF